MQVNLDKKFSSKIYKIFGIIKNFCIIYFNYQKADNINNINIRMYEKAHSSARTSVSVVFASKESFSVLYSCSNSFFSERNVIIKALESMTFFS